MLLRNMPCFLGAQVAQQIKCWPTNPVVPGSRSQVKCWPTNPVVPGSRPTVGRNHFNRKQGSTEHSILLSNFHCPDMTKILLKRM